MGLSSQKAAYIQELADVVNKGEIELRTIGRLSDEKIIERLTRVRGIGRWTAQMFLIFGLGRLDVFPEGDAGLRNAVVNRYELASSSDERVEAIAKQWRPYSTVAVWYCWRSIDLAKSKAIRPEGFPS